MSSKDFLRRVGNARRDLSPLLFHFTRDFAVEHPYFGHPSSPLDNLFSMLSERRLRASSLAIKGGHECVCFTETPITELAALFRSVDDLGHTPYAPIGLAIRKDTVFQMGGRPVIYQSASEYLLLSDEQKFRHVRYEPHNGIDFTWEREWRVPRDVELEPIDVLVVVDSHETVLQLRYSLDGFEDWTVVSLDLLV